MNPLDFADGDEEVIDFKVIKTIMIWWLVTPLVAVGLGMVLTASLHGIAK